MPSVYDLKPRFQGLLRPMVRVLATAGVTANQVTVATTLLSLGYGVWLLYGGRIALIMLPVLLLVRMALNAVDGMLAREHNMKSRLGALLNELGDVASDAGLYLPLGFVLGTYALVPVLITVVLLALGEMAGILGQVLTDTRHYHGPMGKSDRAVAFGGLALVHGLFGLAPMVIGTVLWLIVALSCMTVFNRCRASLAAPARGASEQ